MFSNVGWVEIAIILVMGLVVIGPERLPGLIKEARAVLLAARNAVAEARQQLGEDFGDEIEEIRKPLQQLGAVRQMGAKGLITRTLLDGDDSFLTPFTEAKEDVKNTVQDLRGARGGSAAGSAAGPTHGSAPSSSSASEGSSQAESQGRVEVQQQAAAGESKEDPQMMETVGQQVLDDSAAAQRDSPRDQGQAGAGEPQRGQPGAGQPGGGPDRRGQQHPGTEFDDVL
ncbi:twin-arginine translocase TatA/TatE family subunit [Corynebacterium heidelbergense]|uniref:twin-arginine translocase TatA/TatE family subunit n=1 Tax=Corynebacterium heidelbergense TaxID=2055947 RepID=UPI0015EEA730|nr:twin-arginine translocase TatA/TatE family subunit [Corynebacterium heidelbergense]WCZ36936.1 sec-independent translocase [Corynebacterium heidelbergense]